MICCFEYYIYICFRCCGTAFSSYEGFRLIGSEAMVFGKPIIGSNVGGIPLQLKRWVSFEKADHYNQLGKGDMFAQNSN